MAVRIALGAGRGRILRQLLTESTLLALLGAAGGLLLASWGLKTLLALNPETIPRLELVRIDATVGVATLGLALITAFLFGLAPAMQIARTQLQASLKEGMRGSGAHQGLGRSLVAAEIALAVVVVIGAALLMRSFWALRNQDPGFVPEQVLAIDLSIPSSRYDDTATSIF
jgi:putative ABC transport system permease protein